MLVSFPVSYANLSANGVIKAGPGELYGIVVTASAAGIIQVFDNASAASGTVLYASSGAVSAGQIITFNSLGIKAKNGLFFNLVSGTVTVNALYI